MTLNEIRRNVFDYADIGVPLVHCIAADLAMGAGIAVKMQKHFHIRGQIQAQFPHGPPCPGCVSTKGVYNLITKKRSSGKPTYDTMQQALCTMRGLLLVSSHKHIAMPYIGCGLDRLSWAKVRELISDVFKDTDLTITACRI